jgi:hypothetical protein
MRHGVHLLRCGEVADGNDVDSVGTDDLNVDANPLGQRRVVEHVEARHLHRARR